MFTPYSTLEDYSTKDLIGFTLKNLQSDKSSYSRSFSFYSTYTFSETRNIGRNDDVRAWRKNILEIINNIKLSQG